MNNGSGTTPPTDNSLPGTYYCKPAALCSAFPLQQYLIEYDDHANSRSTPVAQLAPRNLLTRWDVSSIQANGIFLTKN